MTRELEDLHQAIDSCFVCGEFVKPLNKPRAGLDRGTGSEIFIIGLAPGNTEQTSGRAFSGNSGTRLDQWLVSAGRPAQDPRRGVYLTSLLKCACPPDAAKFRLMWRNCRHFLDEQLELLRPMLVITLGRESFEFFHLARGDYNSLIGKLFVVDEEGLFAPQPFKAIVHWPHPSGLSRWHNLPKNRERIDESIAAVRAFLEETR